MKKDIAQERAAYVVNQPNRQFISLSDIARRRSGITILPSTSGKSPRSNPKNPAHFWRRAVSPFYFLNIVRNTSKSATDWSNRR
jgi:hypothetical protein